MGLYITIQYETWRARWHFSASSKDGLSFGAVHLHKGVLGIDRPYANTAAHFEELGKIHVAEASSPTGGG